MTSTTYVTGSDVPPDLTSAMLPSLVCTAKVSKMYPCTITIDFHEFIYCRGYSLKFSGSNLAELFPLFAIVSRYWQHLLSIASKSDLSVLMHTYTVKK